MDGQSRPDNQFTSAFKDRLTKLKDLVERDGDGRHSKKKHDEQFSDQELLLLWHLYRMELSRFPTEGRVTRDMFKSRFADLGNDFVKDGILQVIDSDNNGIDFVEFMSLFRVITRGSPEEHRQLVFAIYDWDRDGTLSREEMEKIINGISWQIKKRSLGNIGHQHHHKKNKDTRDREVLSAPEDHEQKDFNYYQERNAAESLSQNNYKMQMVNDGTNRPDDVIVNGQKYRLVEEIHINNSPTTIKRLSMNPNAAMFTLEKAVHKNNDINNKSFNIPPKAVVGHDDTDSDQETDISEENNHNNKEDSYININDDSSVSSEEEDYTNEDKIILEQQINQHVNILLDEAFGDGRLMNYNEFVERSILYDNNPIFNGIGIIDHFRDSFFGPLEKKNTKGRINSTYYGRDTIEA